MRLALQAGKMDESEEVFDVVFPSTDESSEAVHPFEESSDKRLQLLDAMRIVGRLLTEQIAGLRREVLGWVRIITNMAPCSKTLAANPG